MDELLRDFLNETAEHIEGVENELVLFERNPRDPSPIAKIFRLVHTIKGTSSFLGLERLQRVTHAAETLIGTLRDGAPPTQKSVSLILAALDRVKQVLASIEELGEEAPGDDNDIVSAIEGYLRGDANPEAANFETEDSEEDGHDSHEPEKMKTRGERGGAARAGTSSERPAGGEAVAASRGGESIRVAVGTIERIMELVSELVLARNQLLELTRHGENDAIKAPLQRLSALTSDLQDAVMRARMQPMTRLFSSLPRLVRELAADLGKKIDLSTSGADTELDRQLIDVIRDPLTHLIRNCADHGIEAPEERIAAGKPELGTISVSAAHEAGQITIEISDDGRGLDPARIGQKAVERGLIGEAQLKELSDDEIYRFILEPGFSTAETVTTVSGRGVGMDVVRSNLESIGGAIAIASSLGRGARFTLKIPLTLAIAPALIVAVHHQRFALPQHAVVEAVGVGGVSRHALETVQNALVLRLRDEVVPVVDLRAVLELEPAAGDGERLVVIMRVGGNTFGVIVDGVCDVQEIVVKPLGALFSSLDVFSGHTILGDGTVVLILDASGLAGRVGVEKSAERAGTVKTPQAAHRSGTNLAVFRAGRGALKVLPLSLISRIAMVETQTITEADGRLVFRYQEKLTPLVPVSGQADFTQSACQVLILVLEGQTFGLWVDEVLDIMEDALNIQLASTSDAIIGTAEVNGQPVELIDAGYYFQLAFPERAHRRAGPCKAILVVDNEPAAADMLAPSLAAAGYEVSVAASPQVAASLLKQDNAFDAVLVSAGLKDAFAAQWREADSASLPPVIELRQGGHFAQPADEVPQSPGRFDRAAILATLARSLDRQHAEIAA